ncbi:energy transducer TonB [Shewanella woodyi]|uniref:energy transducer TonB n=1 Tax=Shewanella woodyi TaxID=60961 RepID=UPI0007F92689|nr:energy transducer TonB [Shewanella woodyi]
MVKTLVIFLLAVALSGCKSTVADLKTKPGRCYQVEYIAKPNYTPSVSQKVVAAINRFNSCDFIEANTILRSTRVFTAFDSMLVASYSAQLGALDMMQVSLQRGNYEQVVSSSEIWANLVKIDNDPRITKELYIAHRMLENKEQTSQLTTLAFETPEAAERYFSQWHQKSFPQLYKEPKSKLNATTSLQGIMHEQLVSKTEISRPRYPGETVNDRLNRSDLSKPFSIYKVAPEAISPGWVLLSFSVNRKGRTEDIKVIDVSPEGGFETDAINTISKWLYLPAESKDGKPIKTEGLKVKLEVSHSKN